MSIITIENIKLCDYKESFKLMWCTCWFKEGCLHNYVKILFILKTQYCPLSTARSKTIDASLPWKPNNNRGAWSIMGNTGSLSWKLVEAWSTILKQSWELKCGNVGNSVNVKYVRGPISNKVLMHTCGKMSSSVTDIAAYPLWALCEFGIQIPVCGL